MQATYIGIDLAKNIFQVHWVDAHGNKLFNMALKRDQITAFFTNLPPALVGMEAPALAQPVVTNHPSSRTSRP